MRIGYWKKKHKGEGSTILQWSNYFPERRGLKPRHIIISYEDGKWHRISDTKNIILETFHTKKDAKKFAVKYMKDNPSGMR